MIDAEGRIIYHENPARIGHERGITSRDRRDGAEQPLDYLAGGGGGVDQARVRARRRCIIKTSVLYSAVILVAFWVGLALLLQQLKPVGVVKDAMESAE